MGLLDNIKGRKGKNEDLVLEPRDDGYALKGQRARSPGVTKICFFFNSAGPLKDEPELLKSLIKELHVEDKIARDAIITAVYEAMPDIDQYLSTRVVPDSLNAFIMTRAFMKGLARSQAEMGRLAVDPFDVKGVKGVVVMVEA